MTGFVEYVVSELKSKRISRAQALDLIKQYSSRSGTGGGASVIHPLLHRNVSDFSRQGYCTTLEAGQFFLDHHRLAGDDQDAVCVLPGVAYLEMARAALEQATLASDRRGVLELQDIIWLQPCLVKERQAIFIDLDLVDPDKGGDSQFEYEIFVEHDDDSVVHCRGRAAYLDSPAPAALDLNRRKAAMQRQTLEPEAVYSAFRRLGLHYGPAHQGITAIYRGDDEVLATIRLPAVVEAGADDFVLHPSLMDSALQCTIGLVDDLAAHSRPALPFALQTLRIFAPCTRDMWVWVRYAAGSRAGDSLIKLDIDLCDAEGRVCIQMQGFSSREFGAGSDAPRERLAQTPSSDIGPLLARPHWETTLLESPVERSAPEFEQHHVLLCGWANRDGVEAALDCSSVTFVDAADQERLDGRYSEHAVLCFEKVREVLESRPSGKVLVQVVAPDDGEGHLFAGLSGLLKTAHLENPNFLGQLILVESGTSAELLAACLQENQARPQDGVLRYRKRRREVLRWQAEGSVPEAPRVAFRDNGVYWITGGLGGLGRLFAREILTRTTRARVILTGRAEPSADTTARLASLADEDRLEYRQVDLARLESVTGLVEQIVQTHGRLDGVLHSAGMIADNFILKKDAAEFRRVLAPKVTGTVHLDLATQDVDLDFLVLFSSIAGVMGNPGQADYAAANGFMDQFAGYRNQLVAAGKRKGMTLAAAWPVWQDGGMQLDRSAMKLLADATGMRALQTATGFASLYRLLELGAESAMVMEGERTRLTGSLLAQSEKQPVTEVASPPQSAPGQDPTGDARDLVDKTREFLLKEFSRVLRIPSHKIDSSAALEAYGIDSILAMNLTSQLEKTFGNLPKTLFFEYKSVDELADYVTRAFAQKLGKLLGGTEPPAGAPTVKTGNLPAKTASKSPRRRRLSRTTDSASRQPVTGSATPVAIVGLSGRFPESINLDQFWDNLSNGRDCITEVPESRWRWRDYCSETGDTGPLHTSKWGGFIAGFDEFDPLFFGISPREALYIDPQERLFLQHAWMAIEDAGYSRRTLTGPDDTDRRVGVYVGVMYGEYNRSGSLASIANRVSYVLDVHGPSMTLDTMCSSSLTALHLACQDLKQGKTSLALAGGVNLSLYAGKYSMLSAGQFISRDGHCQSFGEGGDGYIPAEGVGVAMLKLLPDAERDGNHIYGIIRGSAINHGGKTNGYTVPNPKAQADAIVRALEDAGVNPRHMSYIEAHGTGTRLGDPIEIAALSQAFARYTSDHGYCLIGSVKSNVGHCESAAGMAGLSKVLLQLRHSKIVASLHSTELNPHIDFDNSPFVVNQSLTEWKRPVIDNREVPRLAGISSFGAGGANAHLIVEEYTAPDLPESVPEGREVAIVLSARTEAQLQNKMDDLLAFLERRLPQLEGPAGVVFLHDMAYTLQLGREPMEVRVGILANSLGQLIDKLKSCCAGDPEADAYRANVSAHKETLSSLGNDTDFQETVGRWLQQARLHRLVDLWTKGLTFDWSKLYADSARRLVSLPTYPFARERYWLDVDEQFNPRQPGAAAQLHPLAHINTSNGFQNSYESVFSGAEPFLIQADSDKGRSTMLPAATAIEMVMAAFTLAYANPADDPLVTLQEVQWGEPCWVGPGCAITTAMFGDASGQSVFEVSSCLDGRETVHAQGYLMAVDQELEPVSGESLSHARYDAALDEKALAHHLTTGGVDFHSDRIRFINAWCSDRRALIEIQLLEDESTDADLLPPGFLHQLVSVGAALVGHNAFAAQHLFPDEVDSIRFRPKRVDKVRAIMQFADEGSVAGAGWGLDIDLVDQDGGLFLAVRGMRGAPLTAQPPMLEFVQTEPVREKPRGVELIDLDGMGNIGPHGQARRKPKVELARVASVSPVAPQGSVRKREPAPSPMVADNGPSSTRPQPLPNPPQTLTLAGIRDELRASLSRALYMELEDVGTDKSFVDLGLDSIVGVEWVKAINDQYGLDISATRVYDYSNIEQLADFLLSEIERNGPGDRQAASGVGSQAQVERLPEIATATTPPAPVTSGITLTELQEQLRASLARALYVDVAEIDLDKPFAEIGLDSIVGVEWVNAINDQYKLSLPATRVYDYSSIRDLADFLIDQVKETTATGTDPASSPAPPASRDTVDPHTPAMSPSSAARRAAEQPPRSFRTLTRMPRAGWSIARQPAGQRDGHRDPEEKIAIVGISGRYPQARDLEEYWSNLAQGRNAIGEVPAFRWDVNQYFDPDPQKPGKVYCKWLGALDDIECFDPLFFQVSPAEAELMDPQHRLFLQEAYRAFENAGYADRQLSNTRCGVYLGIMSSEYSYLLSSSSTGLVNTTANSFAIGAARIAYYLNLKGPAIPVDTACSSSLVAIHLARQGLLNHEIDMALAGGVSLYLIPEAYQGMCQAGMLSPEGQCKTFDNSADGFVPGEGVGAVVLKRLSDARRDRDHVYGVILASAINQDGKTNGITAPSVNSQIELERDLYSRYRIDPNSISYVEAHGTGTKLGDPIELEALATVFGEETDRKQFCAIGSVKSNIGHTSGAAGVASVHKVLLALRHKTIPKTLHFNNENSLFRFADSPFYVASETHPWEHAEDVPRRASISSFGFSGTNAHLVLEEYEADDAVAAPAVSGDRSVAILVSARTPDQLRQRALDLLGYFEKARKDPGYAFNAELADIAYTLQTGRTAMRCRLGFVADSFEAVISRLQVVVGTEASEDPEGLFRNDVAPGGSPAVPDAAGTARELEHCLTQRQLSRLLELWVEGVEVDWLKLYPSRRPRRIPLPGYPFSREPYWAAPVAGNAAGKPVGPVVQTAAATLPAEDPARLYYQPQWRESTSAGASPASLEGVVLVLGHQPGFERSLQDAADRQGLNLSMIRIRREGQAPESKSADDYTLASDDGPSYRKLLDSLEARDMLPGAVVHCGPPVPSDADLDEAFRCLFLLCQELMKRKLDRPIRILSTYESSHAQARPGCSALSGFFRTLVAESTRYKCKLVEFQNTDATLTLAAERRADSVVDELAGDRWDEIDVRYCFDGDDAGMTRLVKGLTQFDPESLPAVGSAIRHKGVYLITGGLGGVGFLLADHLVRTYRCSLALVGRSAPMTEQKGKIERLEQSGGRVIYIQADVANPDEVRHAVVEVKKAFSRIDGVFHCAGTTRDAFIVNKAIGDVEAVLAPKLAGTVNLDRATAEEPLDLFVLFSSGAGIFGNPGQCDYAFANHFLDSFAALRSQLGMQGQRSGKSVSINWPFWIDGGMTVSDEHLRATEATTGMCALSTEDGLRYLEDFLHADGPQGIAVYGRPTRVRSYLDNLFRSEDRTEQATDTLDTALVSSRVEQYLTGLVAEETKIAEDRIDPRESFEAFGFDSVMIGRLITRMEQDLGELPKTLLYEYPSIDELAGYLAHNHRDSMIRHLHIGPDPDASGHRESAQATVAHAPATEADALLDEPIAIIGVHGIYPGSESLDEYWQNLYEGKDLITTVPMDRWDCEHDYDPDPDQASQGKIYCKWGGFMDGVDRFDPRFFNLDPREASIMDPQERWFLQSVWSVMEDAGYTRDELKTRWPSGKGAGVGVFVGVTSNTYHLIGPEEWSRGNSVTPSSLPWSIANRVSYYFDFHGPSMPVDTACSSSLVAIHLACESLRKQECQVAIAGGVNFYLHKSKYHSLCQKRMLSTDGKCHSFGAGGDGFVPGEGVGSVMLKPLSRAIADSDHVYAVVRGTAVQHSGRSSSYSAPNPTSQAALIARLLKSTATHPESISLVEGHGTGTELGDSLEVLALSQAFRQQTQKNGFCSIGSVKSNIGHSESAAGIAGLTKLILQMKHRMLVPTIQCERPNDNIDFDNSPFVLQQALQPWEPSPGSPRRALLNSFGAGGVNACLLLEEYDAGAEVPVARGPMNVVVLSAKSVDSLKDRAEQLARFVQSHPETDLARLACTLQLGREAMPERLAIVVGDTDELLAKLARWQDAGVDSGVFRGSVPAGKRAIEGSAQSDQVDADLHALAEAWVNGQPVQWERLYAGKRPRRMPLPAYPFASDRYWIDRTEPSPTGIRQTSTTNALHPLVTSNTSCLEKTSFSSLLLKEAYYATDHKLGDRHIFPGAGFLEMAWICGNLAGEGRVTSIRDVVWINPLEFQHDPRNVRTLLRTNGNEMDYEIVTVDPVEGDTVVHCEGKLVFDDSSALIHPTRQTWPIKKLFEQCATAQSGQSYYRAFREAGLDYGPSFQTITQFATDGHMAVARLQISEALGHDYDEYCLHPSMLDGALQTVIGLLGAEDETALYLPFALEQIELFAPIPPACHAHVESIEPGAAEKNGVARFNIRLLSERGTVLASLKNFTIRKHVLQPACESEQTHRVAAYEAHSD